QTQIKPEIGIQAASFGTVMINSGGGSFHAYGPDATGLVLGGDVRAIKKNRNRILVARSNGPTTLIIPE
ncbi:MAG: hypothetical protein AAF840_04345, partial [Bacteroidota bacterium]